MYIDNIFCNDMKSITGSNMFFVCDSEADEMNKIVSFPVWFNFEDNPYVSFKVLFKNGCLSNTVPQSNFSLNGKEILVNKNGQLKNIQYHACINEFLRFTPISTDYITVQENTILDLYYNPISDAFIIVGNPLVICRSTYPSGYDTQFSVNYMIHADGTSEGATTHPIYHKEDDVVVGVEYSLDDGENFTDWQYILVIGSTYYNTWKDIKIIPRDEIINCINCPDPDTQSKYFLCNGTTNSQTRHIVWGCTSENEFTYAYLDGDSQHPPYILRMYGINL